MFGYQPVMGKQPTVNSLIKFQVSMYTDIIKSFFLYKNVISIESVSYNVNKAEQNDRSSKKKKCCESRICVCVLSSFFQNIQNYIQSYQNNFEGRLWNLDSCVKFLHISV